MRHPARPRSAALAGLVALGLLVSVPSTASADLRVGDVESTVQSAVAFDALLAGGGFSLNVIAPAGPRPPVIAFPITSGRLEGPPSRLRGYVNHAGGIGVSRSGVSSTLTNFKLVLGRRPYVGARSGVERIRFLNLSNVRSARVGRRLGVLADASLTTQGAVVLNRAFSATTFTTNQPFGQIAAEITR
jgi:hypothetical protein